MKHLVSVVALACLVVSIGGAAHAAGDYDTAAQDYCDDAVRTARAQITSNNDRNWKVNDAYYEEWREAGWEQFRCVVEAECRKDGDVWQNTSFAGSILEIQRLTCQDGWLKPTNDDGASD